MNSKIVVFGLVGTMLMGTTAVHAKKLKGDDISNMIIEGENRLMVHQPLLVFDWSPQLYKGVPELLVDGTVLGGLKPPSIKDPMIPYPARIESKKGASAHLNSIFEAPVLNLRIRPQKGEKESKVEYTFLIKDSKGTAFYEKKANGVMPPELTWDGFGSKSEPLEVGSDYSYTLSIIDEAGNPQRFSGSPFRVSSFRYKTGGKEVTMISSESVFSDRASTKLSAEGLRYIMETKDHFRPVYNRSVNIVVYDDDIKFGLSQANAIRDILIKELDYPESKITAQGLRLAEGKGYRYVEISSN